MKKSIAKPQKSPDRIYASDLLKIDFCEDGQKIWCRRNGLDYSLLIGEGVPIADTPDTFHSRKAIAYVRSIRE